MPHWFKPTREDLIKLLYSHHFVTFSYPLRVALIIVHFHRKFEKNSAKREFETFNDDNKGDCHLTLLLVKEFVTPPGDVDQFVTPPANLITLL